VQFSGSVELPSAVGDADIQVSALFTMTGFLDLGFAPDGSSIVEPMQGGGTATLAFTPNGDRSAWRFLRANYAFE
jgi:hypothetical protein